MRFTDLCSSSHYSIIPLLLLALAGCQRHATEQMQRVLETTHTGPHLVIVQPERKLGTLTAGKRVETWEILNNGTEILHIGKLEKSCGCVQVRLDHPTLPPGETTKLSIDIAVLAGDSKSATVTLHSNDHGNPEQRVVLTWTANGAIEAAPKELDFGVVRPGVATTQMTTVTMVLGDLKEFDPDAKLMWSAREQLRVDRGERTFDGKTLREIWSITLTPIKGSNSYRTIIDLPSTAQRQPLIRVPVYWEVREIIESDPPSLFLGAGVPEGQFSGKVRIHSDPGTQLEVSSATWGAGELLGEVAQRKIDERTVEIELSGDFPEATGPHFNTLLVQCVQPVEMILEVPVSCLIQAE